MSLSNWYMLCIIVYIMQRVKYLSYTWKEKVAIKIGWERHGSWSILTFLCIYCCQYWSILVSPTSSNTTRILMIFLNLYHKYFFAFHSIILFYFFIFWSIMVLQNFVVFCQISTWISHRYTYIPSRLNLPPISCPTPLL